MNSICVLVVHLIEPNVTGSETWHWAKASALLNAARLFFLSRPATILAAENLVGLGRRSG